jgi:hypothetical protein
VVLPVQKVSRLFEDQKKFSDPLMVCLSDHLFFNIVNRLAHVTGERLFLCDNITVTFGNCDHWSKRDSLWVACLINADAE